MKAMYALVAGLVLVWTVGCDRGVPSSPAPSDSGLASVTFPDASLVSSRQLAAYRQQLALIEGGAEVSPTERASRYGELGKRLFADGFEHAAEPCFLNAQTLDPAQFDWTYYLAHVYAQQGKNASAMDRFEAVLGEQPDDVAAWVSLGNVHLAGGRPGAAAAAFEEALRLQPDAASAHSGLGRARLAEEDYSAAVTALTTALDLVPDASMIHYPLAQALRGAGQTELAEQHLALRGDVEIFPFDPLMEEIRTGLGSPVVLNERGRLAFARGDFAAASEAFRRATEMRPEEAWLHANLGAAMFHLGDRIAASEAFRKANSLAPEDPEVFFSLGAVEESEGRDDRAESLYRDVLAADAKHTGALLRLGHLMRRAERYADAVEVYSAAIRADPRNAPAHLGRAMALARLSRWVDARDAFEQASRSLPDQPAFALAWARVLASAPDAAVRDGMRALQILDGLVSAGQDNTDVGETIAMALAETGEFGQAERIQSKMLALARRSADPAVIRTMSNRLEAYRGSIPWREPWRENHPSFLSPDDAAPAPPRRWVGSP